MVNSCSIRWVGTKETTTARRRKTKATGSGPWQWRGKQDRLCSDGPADAPDEYEKENGAKGDAHDYRVGPSGHPLRPPSEPYVRVSPHRAQAFQWTPHSAGCPGWASTSHKTLRA